MNWSLIAKLSLFGLAMAFATVYVIPSRIEPIVWLVIFVVCAWVIARSVERRHFLHGLFVSIVNGVWITTAHVALFHAYITRHPEEAAMAANMPLSPRVMMLVTGPLIGVVSGVILGLFALVASKFVKRPA